MNPMRRVSLVLVFLTLAGRALAAGILIGHAEVMAATNIPASVMEQVAGLKWFFAHASVGDNMMDGITALRASDPDRYPIQRQADDEWPPSPGPCEGGFIYDYGRGNPDWSDKVQWFEAYASNGWRNPSVNICLNKFCWIDPDVDTNAYLQSMAGLEGRYPDTLFVYMTIPLTGDADGENTQRNAFNRTVREFCSANGRVLYDVADIEAHDTNGAAQTYSTTNQWMYDGFAVDPGAGDWHLNAVGRPWVARGFYALGAALFGADRDGDRMSDGAELIAGTCPTSDVSVFRLDAPVTAASSGVVVRWSSASNRVYALQRATNLVGGAALSLAVNVTGMPPANVCTDFPAGPGPFFYWLDARQLP